MAKNYWKSKAGKAATKQAAATDAAGAMRVGPALGSVPSGASLGNALGRRALGSAAPMTNKQIAQGPSTGFGMYRDRDRLRQYVLDFKTKGTMF